MLAAAPAFQTPHVRPRRRRPDYVRARPPSVADLLAALGEGEAEEPTGGPREGDWEILFELPEPCPFYARIASPDFQTDFLLTPYAWVSELSLEAFDLTELGVEFGRAGTIAEVAAWVGRLRAIDRARLDAWEPTGAP